MSSMSEYERQRLENIKENEALLRTLDIPTMSRNKPLRKHTAPVKTKEPKVPSRVSARIRGEPAIVIAASNKLDLSYNVEHVAKKFKTIESLGEHDQAEVLRIFKKLIPNIEPQVSTIKEESTDKEGRTPDQVLKNKLAKLEIKHGWATVKVTPHRINACLFHPSDAKLLGCAVDVEGYLGFWDIKQQDENGDPVVYNYKPHTRTVSDMHFNPVDNTKLMTSSYDGLVRIFDTNKAEFETVIMDEKYPFSSFDISQDGHSLWFSTSGGEIGLKDLRSNQDPIVHQSREKKVGCVHLNPIHQNLIAAASNDRSVGIWDIRMWNQQQPALYSFEHGYSVTSCYWSPKGDMLATTAYDDYVRLFNYDGKSSMELKSAMQHNNHTGRWISNFKARWNTNNNINTIIQHLMIGNMKQTIDIYSGTTGNHIIQLYDKNHITAIPSVNSFHPNTIKPTILAGNASGRMICWE